MSTTSATSQSSAKSKLSKRDAILQNASAAIDAAKELSPLLPVPFLAVIFSSAKVIVDTALVSDIMSMLQEHAKELTYVLKLVKQNKQAIAELANRVAVITRDVRATLRGKEQYVDESLRLALEQINK